MANDLQQIWRAESTANTFTNPEDLMDRTSAFERKVRRRNLIEYAAGGLIMLVGTPAAVMLGLIGEPGLASSVMLVVIGTGLILWNLHRRASTEKRLPEDDCRSHLRRQYQRQADSLRKVPQWYIGPLLPGVLGIYGTIALKAVGRVDAWEILTEVGRPLGFTLVFFGIVIWLNLRAARSLQRQAEELEAA